MFIRKNKIIIIILQPVDGATDGATRRVICPASYYTNIRVEFIYDRLAMRKGLLMCRTIVVYVIVGREQHDTINCKFMDFPK